MCFLYIERKQYVRKFNKSGWQSYTSFVTNGTPRLFPIGSCQHQLGLFRFLGGKCFMRKVNENVNLPSAIWGNLDTRTGFYVVMPQFTGGGGGDQHTPPSIYLILKIIFPWVWLASARTVTHTGIQTKAALAPGQRAGAGWSMSILSPEELLGCFQTCFGLGRWCIHLFIRNVLTGNANSLHLGKIALETAGGTQQTWLGRRLLLLALEPEQGLL